MTENCRNWQLRAGRRGDSVWQLQNCTKIATPGRSPYLLFALHEPAMTDRSFPAQPNQFPAVRLRRRRSSDWMRRLVQENHLQVEDLIWPIFVQ